MARDLDRHCHSRQTDHPICEGPRALSQLLVSTPEGPKLTHKEQTCKGINRVWLCTAIELVPVPVLPMPRCRRAARSPGLLARVQPKPAPRLHHTPHFSDVLAPYTISRYDIADRKDFLHAGDEIGGTERLSAPVRSVRLSLGRVVG
jgi:hypothetical protein